MAVNTGNNMHDSIRSALVDWAEQNGIDPNQVLGNRALDPSVIMREDFEPYLRMASLELLSILDPATYQSAIAQVGDSTNVDAIWERASELATDNEVGAIQDIIKQNPGFILEMVRLRDYQGLSLEEISQWIEENPEEAIPYDPSKGVAGFLEQVNFTSSDLEAALKSEQGLRAFQEHCMNQLQSMDAWLGDMTEAMVSGEIPPETAQMAIQQGLQQRADIVSKYKMAEKEIQMIFDLLSKFVKANNDLAQQLASKVGNA